MMLAGLYGILHNQISFSISPEYFQKFKFPQTGLEPDWVGGERRAAAMIGFLSSWWAGFLAGLFLSLASLASKDPALMKKIILKGARITFFSVIAAGFLGFLMGRFLLASQKDWFWVPEGLSNPTAFITAGTIHTATYIGAAIGLLISLIYMVRVRYYMRSVFKGDMPGGAIS
jgi:hypothetical protein